MKFIDRKIQEICNMSAIAHECCDGDIKQAKKMGREFVLNRFKPDEQAYWDYRYRALLDGFIPIDRHPLKFYTMVANAFEQDGLLSSQVKEVYQARLECQKDISTGLKSDLTEKSELYNIAYTIAQILENEK